MARRGDDSAEATVMTIRVLIADDQDLVRAGFRLILEATDGIDVVGEADNGRDAVARALHLRPDVCLFDIRMPELDGIEATNQIAGPGVADPLREAFKRVCIGSRSVSRYRSTSGLKP